MATIQEPIPLGRPAPDFTLPAIDGTFHGLAQHADADVLVVAFLCNHCPYVNHVETELGRIAAEYAERGVQFLGICSNDTEAFPEDGIPGLRGQVARAHWTFPYLIDEAQDVARAYGAACTPDFFVHGRDRTLTYRGAMDESSPGNDAPNDGAALRAALDATLAEEPVPRPHIPPMGCGIKWRAD